MNNDSAPLGPPDTFSADPGTCGLFLLGAVIATIPGVLFAYYTHIVHSYDWLVFAVLCLGAAYSLGKRAMARTGRINIHRDRIEWLRLGSRRTVLFDGTEQIVPVHGGFAFRRGTHRIPLYRRHPYFIRIETLLEERSEVFRKLNRLELPLTLKAKPTFEPSSLFTNYVWAGLLLINLDDILYGRKLVAGLIIGAAALFFLSQDLVKRYMGFEVTFEPDRIVIKNRLEEKSISADDVRCNAATEGSLCLSSGSGKVCICLQQRNTPVPLSKLREMIDQTYRSANAKTVAKA
jgi:hypothetical protein